MSSDPAPDEKGKLLPMRGALKAARRIVKLDPSGSSPGIAAGEARDEIWDLISKYGVYFAKAYAASACDYRPSPEAELDADEAVAAARRILAVDYGMVDEDDARRVANALLSPSPSAGDDVERTRNRLGNWTLDGIRERVALNDHISASLDEAINAACDLAEIALRITPPPAGRDRKYQDRVNDWMQTCFGPEISADKQERNHRFLEEALELVQALGCTASEAHQLVDYTFGRQIGQAEQEVGGVMVTLAALCLASGFDMAELGEVELRRIWTKVEVIRAKQAAKPKHSPLPEAPPIDSSAGQGPPAPRSGATP